MTCCPSSLVTLECDLRELGVEKKIKQTFSQVGDRKTPTSEGWVVPGNLRTFL